MVTQVVISFFIMTQEIFLFWRFSWLAAKVSNQLYNKSGVLQIDYFDIKMLQ